MNDPKSKKVSKKPEQINKSGTETINKTTEELKRQAEDYKNKYLRALADYQNFEKRVREEKDGIGQSAIKNVLLKLLPFLDDLEKAELFIKDSGLKLIRENFYRTLQQMGLEELRLSGKPYDPFTAEAIEIVSGKDDNVITAEIRKGYKFKDSILRVAQVKVSKKIQNSESKVRN